MNLNKGLEYIGSILVVAATLIVTSNIGYMVLAFIIYSLANAAWVWLGVRLNMHGLIAMNLFLMLVNFWGIGRWM